MPLDLASTPAPRLPRGRLSRAATLAFGATLASATAFSACGGDAEDIGSPSNAGAAGLASAGASLGGGGTVYGGPAQPFGGQSGIAGFPNVGEGGAVPIYGGAPGEDAGMGGTVDLPGAGGTSAEAGAGGEPSSPSGGTSGHGGGSAPIYGAPPRI
jgi:hypothetical protein